MTTHVRPPNGGGQGGFREALRQQAPEAAQRALAAVSANRGWLIGVLLVAGLAAFELFNFSTTQFALEDWLGGERFLGLSWASVLAFAFCALDFAGLGRLFTPNAQGGERLEVWYLAGAWFLGAAANAVLTWWAVLVEMSTAQSAGSALVGEHALLTYVPVLIAGLVWLTRVSLISAITLAGPRLFANPGAEDPAPQAQRQAVPARPARAPTASTAPEADDLRPLMLRPLGPRVRRPVPPDDRDLQPAGIHDYGDRHRS